jgi:hypothetical protein
MTWSSPSSSAGSRWSGDAKPPVQEPLVHEGIERGENVAHKMRVAFPSRGVARRLGLNRNHALRVWCDCQTRPSGTPWGDENDPRRLGNYDALGVVDTREAGSASKLFKKHLEESQ